MSSFQFQKACHALRTGKLLVYPTESVYGLGCLAQDLKALTNLRRLKRRPVHKGLIVLCASLKQLQKEFPEIQLTDRQLARLEEPQDHPTTWLVPFPQEKAPLLVGKYHKIAIRITKHPVANRLCEQCGALVSTSANPNRVPAPRDILKARKYFKSEVEYLDMALGKAATPSQIIDLCSGEIIRAA